MRKIILSFSVIVLVITAFVYLSGKSFADNDREHPHGDRDDHNGRNYNPDNQLSNSACGSHLGKSLIDVKEKVQNDADSGQAGNYWAFDYYTRNIQVWSTGGDAYCAIVTYDGRFYAVPGQVGPGNDPSGALINTPTDQPVNGSMSGGYRATFNGTLTSGSWPTHGNVGTVNYQCDILGNCLNAVDWVNQYFPGYTNFAQPWWGWRYNGGSHGTWINSVSGDSGNIL